MFEVEFTTTVGLIVGISEVIKRTSGNTITKSIPVLNLALGILGGVIYLSPTDLRQGVFIGLCAGLSASGLYSGSKNVKEGLKPKKEQGE